VNIALNPHLKECDISAKRLVWSIDIKNTQHNQSDLILVSNCTHFQEFHACLAYTIAENLRIGGVAILLQQPRGNSLANFVTCVESSNDLFQVHLFDSYYGETLTRLYTQHYRTAAFDSHIHYSPQLLILQKLREVTHEDRVAMTRHLTEQREIKHRNKLVEHPITKYTT
jgi:hypothetical protein